MSRTSRQARRSLLEVLTLAVVLLGAIEFNLPLQAQAPPLNLSPKFTPDPTELSGVSGGSTAASQVSGQTDTSTGGCLGYVNSQPNHSLNLKAFFNYLKVQVLSSEDTTIVVRGPGGTWCNDDFQNRNAGLDGEWLPGTYQIWVGAYRPDQTVPYTLRITEVR